MRAVIIKEHGVAALENIQEPAVRQGYFKIKTVAMALNPTDVNHVDRTGRVGGIVGCDVSGVVVKVGEGRKTQVKKGDAVYGQCHGANMSCATDGAFAEYALVRDGHLAKIPEGLRFEEAATLGLGITTVGQALYMTLGLPLPGDETSLKTPVYVLIYGGSTATGTLAIQFAKASGLSVVTTASPANFDLVKSRGADAVFDYHDPQCARRIKEYTHNSLHHVLDCISTEASYHIVAEAMPERAEIPMQVVALRLTDTWPRPDIQATPILAYTTFGEAFTKFDMDIPVMPSHYEFGVTFWKLAAELIAAGRVVPHPVALRDGGLAGIPFG
ncbi:zinc-binding oxidoreductase [Apiospora marii]|uniref:zinc-binding oxidoreductase n=1 Tax=Apiospora marii TaxID=335849 RepID=UPI00312E75F9